MQEVAWVRHLVDRAVERLEAEPPSHPLRRLEQLELRRQLAEAAWREIRALQREAEDESERRR